MEGSAFLVCGIEPDYETWTSMRLGLSSSRLGSVTRSTPFSALAVTPGFLRSEAMLDNFGVTEAHWEDAIDKARGFSESETPCFVGRAVAALAADPNVQEKTSEINGTVIIKLIFADILKRCLILRYTNKT